MYSLIIVDDDELIRKGLEKVIPWHDMGIEVIGTFSSADDALSFLHESIADIILTDVKMPGMTGLELVEEAKKLKMKNKDDPSNPTFRCSSIDIKILLTKVKKGRERIVQYNVCLTYQLFCRMYCFSNRVRLLQWMT